MTGSEATLPPITGRTFWLALAVVTLLGAGLRLWGVGEQPPLRDETLSAFTAANYVDHGLFGPTMPFHPNLRNWTLKLSTGALGTGVAGLRGPSLLLGILSLPLLALIVLRLTGDRLAAGLAAFLLAIDPVHLTFSRQSIQEVHTAFWILAGVWLALRAFDRDGRLDRVLWLPAAGLAFALAVSSKHHGLFPLLLVLGWAVVAAVRQREMAKAALALAALSLLPLTVYLLTYLPWFERGYSLGDWPPMQSALFSEMVSHTGTADSSTIDDRPWQWFVRPLMGYGNFNQIDGRPVVTIAFAHPLTWLAVLPAAVFLLRRRRGDPGDRVLLALFWVSYLPLALSPRPIWLLSAVAVVPFGLALVARAASLWLPRERRGLLVAACAAALLVGLLLHPPAVGRAWEAEYLRPLVMRFSPHP